MKDHYIVIYGERVELTEDDATAIVDALAEATDMGTDYEAVWRKLKKFANRLEDSYLERHRETLVGND